MRGNAMDDIVFLESRRVAALADVLSAAANEGRYIRFCTGNQNGRPWLKYKIGEGMWSPPVFTDNDPNKGQS